MTEFADLTGAALLAAAQAKIGGGSWVDMTATGLEGLRLCRRARDAQFACALAFGSVTIVVWAIYAGGDAYDIHTEITDCAGATVQRYDIPAGTVLADCIESPAVIMGRLETHQTDIAQAILALGG